MNAQYEIREANSRFWVGHRDENGEWWDADEEGFSSIQEAQAFLEEISENA